MSTRGYKKKRRLEQLQDSPVLRRSPRLSQKRRSHVVSDNPLITTSFSRSTLSSYRTTETTNVLNESGQSVPSNFDQDDFYDDQSSVAESLASVNHDHSYARGTFEQSNTLTARDFEDEQTPLAHSYQSDPVHLYGLDVSEDEGVSADYIDEDRMYNYKYNKERILTPPKTPEPAVVDDHQPSLYYTVLALFMHTLYRVGSLLYLAVTSVLCWDVALLSWVRQDKCFKTLRPFGGLLILLAIFSALACVLIAPFVDIPYHPSVPCLSRHEVRKIVEDVYGSRIEKVEYAQKQFNDSLKMLSTHTHEELLSQITKLRDIAEANHTNLIDNMQESKGTVQELLDNLTSLQMSLDELASHINAKEEDWLEKFARLHQELVTLSHKVSHLANSSVDKDSMDKTRKHLEDHMDHMKEKYEELLSRVEKVEWEVREGHLVFIKGLVEETLKIYGIDHVTMFDYALENAGGQVVASSPTYDPSQTRPQIFGITIPISLARSVPTAIIQPEVHPGDCWCFKGTEGFAVIKLAIPAVVTNVTLEHIPKNMSPNGKIPTAPKKFTIIGKNSVDEVGTVLDKFEYKIDGPSVQTFQIREKTKNSYPFVEFKVESNHGSPNYTCVYRVRVHSSLSD